MLKVELTDREQFVAGDGTILREVLHPAHTDAAIAYSLAHALVRPGQRSMPHLLTGSEVYYILSGTGVMHVEDEQEIVSAGTTIYVPPGASQHIENTGDDHLVFLCIVCPPWNAEEEQLI